MSNDHRYTRRLITFAFALAIGPPLATMTQAANCFEQTVRHQCCPACDHDCKFDAKMGEAEKKCFEVESKVICIPRVVFPWQRSAIKSCFNRCSDLCDGTGCSTCVHNGAKTRQVKVLSTRKFKCPKCEYTWTAEKRPSQPWKERCDSQLTDLAPPVVPHGVPWDRVLIGSSGALESNQPTYTDPTLDALAPVRIDNKK